MGLEYAEENTADLAFEPEAGWDFGELLPEYEASVHNFSLQSVEEDRGAYVEDAWLEGDTGAFLVVRQPEVPAVIEPGRHVSMVVRFKPVESGSFEAQLKAVDGNGTRYRRQLNGQGCRNDDDNRRCD